MKGMAVRVAAGQVGTLHCTNEWWNIAGGGCTQAGILVMIHTVHTSLEPRRVMSCPPPPNTPWFNTRYTHDIHTAHSSSYLQSFLGLRMEL